MTTRAPSLGRGCRAQRGGVGFLFCGEAASSLPSPLGKGDRAAVDRVLSQTAHLRRSPPLFFIPLEPYPARSARHLPHAGKALSVGIVFLHVSCIRFDGARKAVFSFRSLPHWGRLCVGDTAFPIQPPPLRGTSFHRKEGLTTRTPSLGRGCRAQRGGVGFLFAAKPPPLCLPHAGKAVLSLCHPPQPALPLRGQAKEAQEASCASLIGMHFPAEIRCIYFLMSFRIAAEGKTALPEVFLFADIAFDRPAIEESTDIEE